MNLIKGIILFFLFSLRPLQGQTTDTVKYISIDPYYFHLEYLKNDPAMILDVRMPFEYRGRRLRDALNVPSSKQLNAMADTLSMDYYLFLYCTDGYRSKRAAEILYDRGFRRLYNLEGGIVAWRKEDMPVIKGRVRRR
jgi:thioredoxin 1